MLVGALSSRPSDSLTDMTEHAIAMKAALARIPANERYAEVIRHGSMHAGIYAPHESDDQEPHDQDELYVVVQGTGFFVVGEERHPFGPGDLLFAEAGAHHRFESFTPNLAVWAVFYGPVGGETHSDPD